MNVYLECRWYLDADTRERGRFMDAQLCVYENSWRIVLSEEQARRLWSLAVPAGLESLFATDSDTLDLLPEVFWDYVQQEWGLDVDMS